MLRQKAAVQASCIAISIVVGALGVCAAVLYLVLNKALG